MAALGIRDGARGGVDLHERNLGTLGFQFAQAHGELFNLLGGRLFSVEGGKQALDDDGPLARDEQDVRENLFQRHSGRAVDLVQVGLRAAVELGPRWRNPS